MNIYYNKEVFYENITCCLLLVACCPPAPLKGGKLGQCSMCPLFLLCDLPRACRGVWLMDFFLHDL